MASIRATSARVPLTLKWFLYLPDDLADFHCLQCDSPLILQQPDAEDAGRMLGVCQACRCWFLMELPPETSAVVMVSLPDRGFFLRALGGDPIPRDAKPTTMADTA